MAISSGKGLYRKWEMGSPLASGLISGYHTLHISKMGLTKIWEYVTWSMRRPTSGTILATTFTRATVEDILRIRVGTSNTRDKLTWKENKSREFTVKTAYQMALRLNQLCSGEHSSASQDQCCGRSYGP